MPEELQQTVDPLSVALDWDRSGARVALASVTATWGSAPRPVGSVLAIREDGHFEGSVSGGCVEGAVIEAARDVISSGRVRQLEFGVSNSEAWEVGLSCGGRIAIYLEPLGPELRDHLEVLAMDRVARRAAVLATRLKDGQKDAESWRIYPGEDRVEPATDAPDGLILLAAEAARRDRSGVVDLDGEEVFLNIFNPALRLLIVGGVHIAQPLALMAGAAGYEVTVIDPRTAFANPDRFPGVALVTDWPDEAMAEIAPDERTAVVTLTHDPKLDDAALMPALASDVFYVGSLGSKKTHAARLERLARQKISDEALGRIHGPVGLDIGAASPAEIAISIMAEMTAVLRGRDPS